MAKAISAEPGWQAVFVCDFGDGECEVERWPVIAWIVQTDGETDHDAIVLTATEEGRFEPREVSLISTSNVAFAGFFHPERLPKSEDHIDGWRAGLRHRRQALAKVD